MGIALRLPGSPRLWLRVGIAVAAALVAAYLAIEVSSNAFDRTILHTNLFDLDTEATLGAWYSSAQLLLIAAVFSTLAIQAPALERREFSLAAGAMVIASLDEIVMLHERLGKNTNAIGRDTPLDYSWWVVPALIIVIGLVVALRRLPQRLGARTMNLVVVGTAIFLFGAVVVEVVGTEFRRDTIPYALEVAVEEGFEMIGATIVLFALLRHITDLVTAESEAE